MHTYTIHAALLALRCCDMFQTSKGHPKGVLLIHFHNKIIKIFGSTKCVKYVILNLNMLTFELKKMTKVVKKSLSVSLIQMLTNLGLRLYWKTIINNDVLLTVHLSIFISAIIQRDAQKFCFTISLFHASTCFEHMWSSSGGQNCITQLLVSSHL